MTSRRTTRDLENLGTNSNSNRETRNISQHVSKPFSKQLAEGAIPGHVYFLIREQAKSLVAIKNLKDRVQSLENVQDDVCHVVSEMQFQMDHSIQDMMKAKLSFKPEDGIPAKTSQHVPAQSRSGRIVPAATAEDTKKDHESDSKQDSGLDSDCQGHASLQVIKKAPSQGDELLDLLEEIAQKGSGLWKRVEECEKLKVLEEEEIRESLSSQDGSGMLQTCRSLQRRLHVAERDKMNLASQLVYVERVAQDLKTENIHLEERLQCVLRDKQKLESQIHRLHSQFVSSKENSNSSKPEVGGAEGKPKKLGRLRTNEECRNRVADILKESNVLELQKQLLTYIVQNEVLTAKLEHLDYVRMSTAAEIEKTESRLQLELQQLLKERNELQVAVEDSRREMSTLQAKTKMLERVLQAVSQETNQCSSLDACVTSVRSQPTQNGSHQKHLRHHLLSNSLPPVLVAGSEHYVQDTNPGGDSSSYFNITLDDRALDGSFRNSPIAKTGSSHQGYKWASTPIRSHFEKPGFRPFSKLAASRESPSSATKEIKSNQSFLTEFDPLCALQRENSAGRVSDFVDSLDLTPTKIFESPMPSDSPNVVKVPLAQMGNISFPRTPMIRQPHRALRYPDSMKRRSDSCIQNMLSQVDEALL